MQATNIAVEKRERMCVCGGGGATQVLGAEDIATEVSPISRPDSMLHTGSNHMTSVLNSGFSCACRQKTHETLPFQYCNHVGGCSMQCVQSGLEPQ